MHDGFFATVGIMLEWFRALDVQIWAAIINAVLVGLVFGVAVAWINIRSAERLQKSLLEFTGATMSAERRARDQTRLSKIANRLYRLDAKFDGGHATKDGALDLEQELRDVRDDIETADVGAPISQLLDSLHEYIEGLDEKSRPVDKWGANGAREFCAASLRPALRECAAECERLMRQLRAEGLSEV